MKNDKQLKYRLETIKDWLSSPHLYHFYFFDGFLGVEHREEPNSNLNYKGFKFEINDRGAARYSPNRHFSKNKSFFKVNYLKEDNKYELLYDPYIMNPDAMPFLDLISEKPVHLQSFQNTINNAILKNVKNYSSFYEAISNGLYYKGMPIKLKPNCFDINSIEDRYFIKNYNKNQICFYKDIGSVDYLVVTDGEYNCPPIKHEWVDFDYYSRF